MPSINQYEHIDQRILTIIDAVRADHGSCTAGQVANRMKITRQTVIDRCRSLRERGLVAWTSVPGSLRRVEDPRQRLYDLLVQRAVERIADLVDADTGQSVTAWCHDVVAMATAEAWPELIPGERETQGELTAEPTGPGRKPEPSANYCDVCDRAFQSPQALAGHRRSKQHVMAAA